MKISERTLRILKNFSTINPSLLVERGSRLRTISSSGAIYAVADVEEDFPREFGVYSLGKLLGVVGLFGDPEVEFEEKRMVVHEGPTRVNFAYCSPELIFHPPKKEIKPPEDSVDFELRADDFARVQKAMSILGVDEVSFFTDAERRLWLSARAGNNATNDDFSIEIGEVDEKLDVSFAAENLRTIPGNYLLSVNAKLSKWSSLDDEGLNYWIAPKI